MRAATSRIVRLLTRALLPAVVIFIGTYCTFAERTTPVAKGEWGGTGIAMTVTDGGATIQFDCANGTITEQLRMKRDGSFSAEGTLMRNGPGPIREGAQGMPVIFKGKITGKAMTLQMTDAKNGDKLAEYSARQGQSARLHRCY
jgi:hypothetical protein